MYSSEEYLEDASKLSKDRVEMVHSRAYTI
jgi:hypothetical protein